VFPKQVLGRFLHALGIQWLVDPPGAMPLQRRALQSIENAVTIISAGRGKARVKFVIDLSGPYDTDIVRKIAVGPEQPAAIVTRAGCIKMNDLPGRVHTGVRPSRTGDVERMVGDFFQGLFKALLDAKTGFLALPAVVRGTVVLYTERDAHLLRDLARQ